VTTHDKRVLIASGALLVLVIAAAYRTVFVWLVDDWGFDGNYSHGFLILPIALYLTWERRDALRRLTVAPSWIAGLSVIAVSLLLLLVGTVAAETFVTRVSFVGTVAGSILFLFGRQHLRALWFPVAVLLLMIPVPAIIFNRIAFPLQLIASDLGARILSLAQIPVFREGNLIMLAQAQLDVAEACSGIRSLISLTTFAVLYGYFATDRPLIRALLLIATVPVALVTNGLRVAATGVAAHFYGLAATEGTVHELSGWIVFVGALLLLSGIKTAAEAIGRLPRFAETTTEVTEWA
jgi:exosortase